MKRISGSNMVEAMKRFVYNFQADQPRRLHLCRDPIRAFRTMRQKIDHKPFGLWYGFNGSWIDWLLTEELNWLQPLIYEVVLDPQQTLAITNEDEFEAFEDEYWTEPYYVRKKKSSWRSLLADWPNPLGMRSISYIDYPKLAKKYSALEITPYLWSKRLEAMWYYGWDCESGCVWNKKAVKDLRLIAEYDKDTNEYISSLYNDGEW